MRFTIFIALIACTYSQAATAQDRVTVPAGTYFLVRTIDTIDSRQHKAGYRFAVSLEADLMADGKVVAPRGSQAYGVLAQAKQSRRARGKSKLSIELTSIVIKDQAWPVVTQTVQTESESTGRKTLRRTALATGIGALIDGSDGAKTGAIVGASASVVTRGEKISIAAGTILQFRLMAPFTP
jgi:hypothetical protein